MAQKVATMIEQLRTFRSTQPQQHQTAVDLLNKIKLELLNFQLIPPFNSDSKVAKTQLGLARQTLELATLLSIQLKDINMFERHFAQLKPYYFDYSHLLSRSDLQWPILGLNLMSLLVSNKLSEFHAELELLTPKQLDERYISFPIQIEQELMEGSYNKVLHASKELPLPEFAYFMDVLSGTVRDKIAACSEKAYEKLTLTDAQKLLRLKSVEETKQYSAKRGWDVREKEVYLPLNKDSSLDIPALKLVQQHLVYAQELEQIV